VENKPLIAEPAPWDPERPVGRWRPRDLWKRIRYVHKYGVFWVPIQIDHWTYRGLLCDLDRVCLRMLKAHGALTPKELAERLNREKLLHTKPKKTGIHQITAATAGGWYELASRRGLVTLWSHPLGRLDRGSPHWEITAHGREVLRSKFWVFLDRTYRLLPAVIVSGLFIGIFKWLAGHPSAMAWAIIVSILIAEVAVLALLTFRSEKRQAPGVAVVAIETLRSAGKPIPAL
jgi:hypothetical protein